MNGFTRTTVGADEFRTAMRRLAAGVSIISAPSPKGPLGITATAVTSLTAEPPSLLCCVNKNLVVGEAIKSMGRYAVNVLSQEHCTLARRFAGMDGAERLERFDLGVWETMVTGAPLLSGAVANFDCEIEQMVTAATHTIFIGQVIAVTSRENGRPLLYGDGKFTGLAE